MANKVVFGFGVALNAPYQSGAGWTELFYNTLEQTPSGLLNTLHASGNPIGLADKRRKLLTPGWRLRSIKVYSETDPRNVAKASFNAPGTFTVSFAPQNEQPYDRLLYDFVCNPGSRGARVGGIPRAIVDAGGNYTGNTLDITSPEWEWNLRFNGVFKQSLVDNLYGIRRLMPSAPFIITRVFTDGTDDLVSTPRTPTLYLDTADGTGFDYPAIVRISQIQNVPGLEGQWTVRAKSVVAGVLHIKLMPKRNKILSSGVFVTSGRLVKMTKTYSNVVNITPNRGVPKRPGRSLDSQRGRRSNRR